LFHREVSVLRPGTKEHHQGVGREQDRRKRGGEEEGRGGGNKHHPQNTARTALFFLD